MTRLTKRTEFLGIEFDAIPMNDLLTMLKARSSEAEFRYVVTPNVDHMNRLHATPKDLVKLYESAWLCLCDSRILLMLGRLARCRLTLVPGSDLTARMFADVIEPRDPICIIGGDAGAISNLSRKYALDDVRHYNPPMGFIRNPSEVEKCVDFVSGNSARYVFFAVGSPQQEIVALEVLKSGRATGVGFCIGASIDFLTGAAERAPIWMQRLSLEWLHRFASNPRGMFRRYLITGPWIFLIYAAWLARRILTSRHAPRSLK